MRCALDRPRPGQLDPLKEANAAVVLVDHGFKTHEQVTRELGGGDWEANVEQLKAENAKLAEAGGARITSQPSSGADDGEGGSGEDEGREKTHEQTVPTARPA